jgi:hypothetical protein
MYNLWILNDKNCRMKGVKRNATEDNLEYIDKI